jgi:hypothetical protein
MHIAVASRVTINEIMYNPAGNEPDFEYIELFAENSSVGNWAFEGINFRFPNITLDGYVIIANTVDENGTQNDFLDRYNKTDSVIFEFKGSLKNTGETIILRDDKEKIVDVVTYGNWAQENHSIERIELDGYSSDPKNWKESVPGGTPGKENTPIAHNNNPTAIKCDWEIGVLINASIAPQPEWKMKAQRVTGKGKVNFTLHHLVKDQNGIIVKNYTTHVEATTRKTTQMFRPRLNPGPYTIYGAIETNCDINLDNNQFSHIIVVTEEKHYTINRSFIEIESDDTVNFGDIINIKLNLYRGETKKYAVHVVIKNKKQVVSDKITLHARTPFTNYSIRFPVPIKLCNEKLKPGIHDIVVNGLGITQKKEILIEKCPQEMRKQKKEIRENKTGDKIETKVLIKKTNQHASPDDVVDDNETDKMATNPKNILKTIPNFTQKRGIVIYESNSVNAYKKARGLFMSSLGLLMVLIFKKL